MDNMALFVDHSSLSFFDSFIADYYRQMTSEMELARRRMHQLVPPEALSDEPFMDLEPKVPVVEENGERKMKLEFNVRDYKPEEVQVKMLDNNVLQVCAEHEDINEAGETRRRLFLRQCSLPDGVDVEHLRSSLLKDGVLIVEAPAPGLAPSERIIPLKYQ